MAMLLGIDFETTGLNPEVDRIIEVGAVLWDTHDQLPIVTESFYVKPENIDEVWNDEILKVNGIHLGHVIRYGFGPSTAWLKLEPLLGQASHIVAHNGAAFDRLFADKESERLGEEPWALPWIDTQNDIEYPESITTRKLSYLAAEHGFLNPFSHRAMFDVLTMFKILSCYDINEVIRYSQIPTLKIRSLQKFDDNQLAKDRGYRWDGENKIWWRTLKQDKLEKEQAEAPFKVVVLEGGK